MDKGGSRSKKSAGGGGGGSVADDTPPALKEGLSAAKDLGVTGELKTLPNGDLQPVGTLGKIKDQEDFNVKAEKYIQAIDAQFETGNMIPVFMLRRAAPDLSREQFDKYFKGFVLGDKARATALEESPLSPVSRLGKFPAVADIKKEPREATTYSETKAPKNTARIDDSWETPLGKRRAYVKLENKPSIN